MPRRTAHPGPVAEGRLAPDTTRPALDIETRIIARELIHPDPDQPRKHADDELRDDLRARGQLDPITVRPHPELLGEWMLRNGERRWRSAEGVLSSLRCQIREDDDSRAARLADQLAHNTGKPLTPLEEAQAFKTIVDDTGMSPADVAEYLGRPKSSVAERLALLELGPWLERIQSGELPMSHAVKVLLPLRTASDAAHEQAIASFAKDYRVTRSDGAAGLSLHDFAGLVRQAYLSSMYPLAKSKGYGKQPAIAPATLAKHDAECDCGGIMFDLGGGTPRRCCGNPGWWRPLHRAALKAKPKNGAQGRAASGQKQLYLPDGVKTVKSQYGDVPKGVVRLTDSSAGWDISGVDGAFDPADLPIDTAKLVTWPGQGSGYPYVGTSDGSAVKKARDAWSSRYQAVYAAEAEKLSRTLTHLTAKYRIAGGGIVYLTHFLTDSSSSVNAITDVASALGHVLPLRGSRWDRERAALKWLREQKDVVAGPVLTGLAITIAEKITLPSEVMAKKQLQAIAEIRKREIPWKKKQKEEKPVAAKKAPTKKVAGRAALDTFMKPLFPSAALATVVGAKALPKTEVTKKLWAYIKKHGLQDAKNRRMINADTVLRVVFDGRAQVSMFEMTKLMNKQLAGTAEAAALIGTGKRSPKIPLEQLSEETAELPLDEIKVRTCVYCGCSEQDACLLDGGAACFWVSSNPDVCSAPDCVSAQKLPIDSTAGDDGDDDLWDSADDVTDAEEAVA